MLRRILSRKTLIRTGIVLAVLAVLVAIFYAEENWRGQRAWENYRAAAEKHGVKLFLKDFIPPDIPDAENYAAVPVIRDRFVKQENGKNAPNPFQFPTSHQRPSDPDDIKGRRFDAAAWQEFFLKTKLIPAKSDSAAGDILRALEKYEPVLQQFRDASSRPKCKFPTYWEDGVATELPHFTAFQFASRMLALKAHAHLQLGNSPAALAELRHGLRLHEALQSELSLIAGLVRNSILAMNERVVWNGLAAGQWRDEELTALEKQFSALRIIDDQRFAFATERGFANAGMLRQAELSAGELLQETEGYCEQCGYSPFVKWIVLRTFPRGWRYYEIIRVNDYFDWLLARCKGPDEANPLDVFPPHAASKDWFDDHPAHSGVAVLERLLATQSLLVFDSAYKSYLYTYARAQQTRLACVLERFRHTNGAFPQKLEQLVPNFLASVPHDAFDGKPLRYRLNEYGGYDLWSIGPDGKDDGGKIDPKKDGQSQSDWLWHMPGRTGAP